MDRKCGGNVFAKNVLQKIRDQLIAKVKDETLFQMSLAPEYVEHQPPNQFTYGKIDRSPKSLTPIAHITDILPIFSYLLFFSAGTEIIKIKADAVIDTIESMDVITMTKMVNTYGHPDSWESKLRPRTKTENEIDNMF